MNSLTTASNFKLFTKWFSGNSLTAKASLNAFSAMLDFGARIVVGFLINPLLLSGLGSYGYGIWQILGRLIDYMSPASGRPTQALKWTIANKQTSTDYEEKRRDVGSTVAVWLLFFPLLSLLGGLLAWYAPIWLKVPAELMMNVRLVAGLLALNLIMTSLVDVPRSVLAGENLSYKRMGLSTFLVFFSGGLMALALHFNGGLMGVAAVTLAMTLLTGLLFLRITRSYVPWFGISRPSFESVRRFARLSGWFLGWNLVMKLMKASDIVLLGLFGSVELVTVYSLTKYVPEIIIEVVATIVSASTPGLGGIIGSGNLRKAARVRVEIMSLSWLVITAVGATILLWNHAFIQLWVGHEYDAGPVPTLLITLMAVQFILVRNDANIIDLSLDLRHKVLLGLLSVTVSLGLAWVLITIFNKGILGLCVGFIAGRSILNLSYPWIVGRFLNIPFYTQLKAVLRPSLVTALLWAPVPCVSHWVPGFGHLVTAETWPDFILHASATGAMLLPLAFIIGLSKDQRKNILQRFHLVT